MALSKLENRKHVFWQAFFLGMLFFMMGLVLGVYLEQLRVDNSNILFFDSETSLYDSFALGKLSENPLISCENLNQANVDFANQIYLEAQELERFDSSNKITKSLKALHRKYDLLRTLLWMNIIETKESCENVDTVVYLYEYNAEEIQIRSKQIVWSRLLEDLKELKGDELILIPIAVDQKIVSLSYLTDAYNIREYPAVIINERHVLYDHKTVEKLVEFLI